jgi:hypothetical protein
MPRRLAANSPLQSLRLAAAAAAWAFAAHAFGLPIVPGEAAIAPKEIRPAAVLRLAPDSGSQVRLAPLPVAELEKVRGENRRTQLKRVAIGRNRDLPRALAATYWLPVAGGFATQLTVASSEAGSLRVALDLAGLPLETQMVFRGSAASSPLWGPVRVGDIPDRSTPWWSPVTEGDSQLIEFFVPNASLAPAKPRAVGISHLFTTPSSRLTKRTEDIGDSGACNVDLLCSSETSTPGFANAAHSVAEMVFTANGYTMMCTGTLVNDTDASTQVPWFYGANHCFDNAGPPSKSKAEMQSVAATLTTLWFFESTTCGGGPAAYQQLSGGAELVYADAASDVMLLRLNNTPPPGAFYAGWDANPIANGAGVTSFHHPRGDLKKVSNGTIAGFGPPTSGAPDFIEVRWTRGTTEPGSSGGPLFTSDGSIYALRGALWGGSAMCSNMNGLDYFSRLDRAYPALERYLNPTFAPFANFTDLWWDPNESGWGINLVQHASNAVFVVWYTYDANHKMLWLHMSSGRWTSASTYTGELYETSGPPANGPFDPARVQRKVVGSATLSFSNANSGTLTYTYYGMAGSKNLTRLAY